MIIAVIDNKMGNIKSVTNVLTKLNVEYYVTSNPEDISDASGIILPGVGSFGVAAKRLEATKFDIAIKEHVTKGKPFLGICLGMQLLFEYGEEGGGAKGLSLLPGKVIDLNNNLKNLPLPHVGWNDITVKESSLLSDVSTGDCVYFVHGFEVVTDDKYVTATTHYGKNIVAAVQKDNIYGTQFHPEKSQKEGISILNMFIQLC
jgi:glutamine amidotransferase